MERGGGQEMEGGEGRWLKVKMHVLAPHEECDHYVLQQVVIKKTGKRF